MGDRKQLDLFGAPSTGRVVAVGPATHAGDTTEVAKRLPSGVRLGTSSWSFPGWAGLVYDREARSTVLAREGLSAYAKHPLLRAVGIDRSYYGPPTVEEFARYAADTPADFRFLVKAHEWLTLARFPRHPRYGPQAGRDNPYFLDPRYAMQEVIGPALEGLGPKLGVMLLQFPPQELALLSARGKFPDRIERFLSALPRDIVVAIEIRNHQLFTPAYRAALRSCGAVHCLSAHPAMHELGHQTQQLDLEDPALPAVVVRWMLRRQRTYEQAKRDYAPFDCLLEPDPIARSAIAQLCRAAQAAHKPVIVIVNNKAEGSAPLSIEALAREIVGP